jgi:hypothetical protein
MIVRRERTPGAQLAFTDLTQRDAKQRPASICTS